MEVTEAAYLAIRSGMPEQYLAPIPIREDIEKELANVKAVQERAKRLNHEAQKTEIEAVVEHQV